MALIDSVNTNPPGDWRRSQGWQEYLAYLETTVVGEPGRPRATPEPYRLPREASELVDGIPPVPEPEKPERKRRKVKPEPALDRDSVTLARYARKLRGEP